MAGSLPADLDRLRSSAIRRSLAVLATVDPVSLWLTWPTAAPALVRIVAGTQEAAAAVVVRHLEQRLADAVGARLGWDLTGLATGSVDTRRLAARMAATPQLVSARVAAGATPAEAFAKTATWVTQVAGSVAHETARQGVALAAAAVPVWSGWRWDPEAGACPWCRMQATRGAVFTADTVLHSHAHCRCDAVEVTDRAEAGRVAADGRAEWRRMLATGDVPASQRRRGLPGPGADPSLVLPGAQTPERLASVRAQIASYERNPATGGQAREWQEQRLAELRAEEARLTPGGTGGKPPTPPRGHGAPSPGYPGRPSYDELVGEAGRVADDLRYLGEGEPERIRARQRRSAARLRGVEDVSLRSVRRRTGPGQRTPDVVVDEWRATLDIKTLNSASKSAVHEAIRKGRRQATHIFIDFTEATGASREACEEFLDAALRSYPGQVDWVLAIGRGWEIRR